MRAVENALGITIPDNARLLRNLLEGAQFVQRSVGQHLAGAQIPVSAEVELDLLHPHTGTHLDVGDAGLLVDLAPTGHGTVLARIDPAARDRPHRRRATADRGDRGVVRRGRSERRCPHGPAPMRQPAARSLRRWSALTADGGQRLAPATKVATM